MALHLVISALYGVAHDPKKSQCLPTLEDRCFYYIIRNLAKFPPESLVLLPPTIRERLLLNLPAVDIWRLEADGVTKGLNEESLWKSMIDERCKHVSPKRFHPPLFHKTSSRDLYFMFVWDQVLQQPTLFDMTLSKLLYNVPCVLGVEGLAISELNYQPEKYKLSHATQNNPGAQAAPLHQHHTRIPKKQRVFVSTIRYFGEVCRIRPKHFYIHCVSVGEHMLRILAISSSILQSFMANLEGVRFDGRGLLDSLENFHHETQHKRFKRLFLCIPRMFLGAAIANPRCNLKSIEIDADDSQRASSLLAGVQSALSVGYSKVDLFSLKFHHIYTRGYHPDLDSSEEFGDEANPNHNLTYLLLSDIKQLVDAQLQLRSIDICFPDKTPSTGDPEDVDHSSEGYTKFITAIRKYVQRPNFECLTLRNLLTIEMAQQIIHTFLSLPLSSDLQLLDIRTLDDVTPQPDTILESPGKSLKISGTVKESDGEEHLTPLVFQMLCTASVHNSEVADNICGIVSALKLPVESLQVKSLCLTIRKKLTSSIEASRFRVCRFDMKRPHQRYHPSSDRKPDKGAEFPEIPRVDKIIGNPSLLSLRIKFLTNEDYVSSSQVSCLLSTISNGLQLQSCRLRSLTLPKLDHALDNDDDLQRFFSCIFSLPHMDEFEINLSFVKFSLRCAQMIHSCHNESESKGKVLAKFVLHYDSFVSSESSDLLKQLMSDICKELFVVVSN